MKKLSLIVVICCIGLICKSNNEYKNNSVYVQFLSFINPTIPGINYERIVWVRKGIGFGLSAGAVSMEDLGIFPKYSGSLILGGPKHFFQPEIINIGVGYILFVFDYKFQAKNGFYVKGGITTGVGVVPNLGVGFSF
jgi:hypothetical protein